MARLCATLIATAGTLVYKLLWPAPLRSCMRTAPMQTLALSWPLCKSEPCCKLVSRPFKSFPSSLQSPGLSLCSSVHAPMSMYRQYTSIDVVWYTCSKAVRQFGEVRNGHKFKRPPSKQCIVRYKAIAAAWQQTFGQHQRSGTLPVEISCEPPSWLSPMPGLCSPLAVKTAVLSTCTLPMSTVRTRV